MFPALYHAKIMHKRHYPSVNRFSYGSWALAFDIDRLQEIKIPFLMRLGRLGMGSVCLNDFGPRDGSSWRTWINAILQQQGIRGSDYQIVMITMPRIFGYQFNPITFWLVICPEKGSLRAVLCEVHNTFGQAHNYLCLPLSGEAITPEDVMIAEKMFHVSPFFERDGTYHFRFSLIRGKFAAWIDHDGPDGRRRLDTSIMGSFVPYTAWSLTKSMVRYPLVTVRTLFLIHRQAFRLIWRGVSYKTKPIQISSTLTVTKNDVSCQ